MPVEEKYFTHFQSKEVVLKMFTVSYIPNHTPEKLLDSDLPRDCEFVRNLRANSVIRGKQTYLELHKFEVKAIV